MLTSVIKAQLEHCGSIEIKLPIDIPDHKAREILDAVADVLTDTWSKGRTVRTEKDEFNLGRKVGTDDLDQGSIFDEKVVIEPPYEVKDPLLLEHDEEQQPELMPEDLETPESDIDTVV